jgi:hypothetical protein
MDPIRKSFGKMQFVKLRAVLKPLKGKRRTPND